VVESGLSLGALLDFLIPRGFWFPVLPGHPRITVGGCVGFNVHGKSQYHDGLFGDHVLEMRLMHPQRGELEVSPRTLPDLFELTLGGMGLTGFVTRVKLRVQPLRGGSLRRERVAVSNLIEALARMEELKDRFDQVYSWNDLNRRGEAFGAGFVYGERFEKEVIRAPFMMGRIRPGGFGAGRGWVGKVARLVFGVGPLIINHAYRAMEALKPASQRFELKTGAFPLNGKEIYYELCGSRGFHECQAIVPFKEWPGFTRSLEALLVSHRVKTTLGSLKLFRGTQRHLNFVGDGVCIALDVHNQSRSLEFLGALDALLVSTGSIPNVSKDSRLSAQTLAATYSGYTSFKEALRANDPECCLNSELRRRIDV
jgi:decaprenylphospho-beta-D-ribofuranose 2-oxidase